MTRDGALDAGWTGRICYGGWAGPTKDHVLCDGINGSSFCFQFCRDVPGF